MLQNSIDTDCPTYEEILALYPDRSNRIISGDFEYVDGYLQRTEGMAKSNHFEYYRYHNNNHFDRQLNQNNTGVITWIDPPGDIRTRIKLITIEPSLPEYTIRGVSFNSTNHNSIFTGHDRWIDDYCRNITISATDWIFLLGDTLHLVNNDCDEKYSSYNHIKELKRQKTEMDITTSYKYQLEQWIEQTKQKCKEICFEY